MKTRTQACIDNIVKRGGEKGLSESALPACVSSANVKNERNRRPKSPKGVPDGSLRRKTRINSIIQQQELSCKNPKVPKKML